MFRFALKFSSTASFRESQKRGHHFKMMMIPFLSLLHGPEIEMDVHFEVNMKIKREKKPERQSLVRSLLGLDGPPTEHLSNKRALRSKSSAENLRPKLKGRNKTASDSSSSKDRSMRKRESSYRQRISKSSQVKR